MIAKTLKHWFYRERRDLPWRRTKNPYAVWVSEVMLQQTQVSVVVPYYKRWLESFPTLQALAEAPLEEVIKAWEGLGYYSRARNLKKGAEYIVTEYEGVIPEKKEDLLKVPGIGPYTAGAILSFAFNQKAAAIDGNVQRVMSRLLKIEEIMTPQLCERPVLELLEDEEPWVVMEALIEFGALVCQKRARCQECPLSDQCLGRGMDLPKKKARAKTTRLQKKIALVVWDGRVLVGKRGRGVMEDLWEFPERRELAHLALSKGEMLNEVEHTFTRYHVTLYPERYRLKRGVTVANYEWVPIEKLGKLPFSSGHRQLLKEL